MNYLIHRIKESRGFIAKRAFLKARYMATMIYGIVLVKENQIIIPQRFYKDVEEIG